MNWFRIFGGRVWGLKHSGRLLTKTWRFPTFVTVLIALVLCISAPAQAQLSSSNPPPPVIMTDSNGVDLKSGNFVTASNALGAGAVDDPALSFTPLDVNLNNNVGTPLIGWIQHYTCGTSDDGCVEYLVARLGNKTLTFQRPPNTNNLIAFTGERLVSDPVLGVVIYDNDDTAWYFDGAFAGNGNESAIYQTGTLQKIVYRDGRTINYARASNGDMSVTSNQGYQLVVRSGQSEVRLINNVQDFCDISAAGCTYTQPWPIFIRSVTGTAGNTTITLNDPMSRTMTISSTSVFGTGGHTDTNIYRPGGLHQFIHQQNVILYSQNGQSASGWLITNYSDDFGSATYSYSSTFAQLGTITHAVATHSDGSQTTFNRVFDQESLSDELGETRTYSFFSGTMQPWNYTRIETLLSSVQTPEQVAQSWDYDGMANIIQSTVTPTPGSGQSPISTTSSFNSTCLNGSTCHLPAYTIDARQGRTDYTYDAASGMMLTRTLPPDANGIRPEIRYTWQQLQAVYKQSASGPPAPGSPIWRLMATSTCRTMAGAGCVGTADEIRVTYQYNSNLLPTSESTRSGDGSLISTVTRDYDLMGNVIWVDGPAAGSDDRTYYFWDADREQIGEIGPDPDGPGPRPFLATRRQFDSEGRIWKIETGNASAQTLAALNAMTVAVTETITYDTLGRKLTERRVGGNQQTLTQYSYGYKGLLECVAVRMNPAIYDSLPSSACVLGAQGGQGPDRITRNVYDAAGRVVQVRRAILTNDEAAEVTNTYNASGQVTAVIDGNGNRAALHYDGFGRQDCWIFPTPTGPSGFNDSTPNMALQSAGQASGDCSAGAGGGDYERYGYDANGNRISLRKRDGSTIGYQYDALNRVILKTVPERADLGAAQTRDVYYSYDLQGLQLSARFDSQTGEGITNTYDGLGRLVSTSTNMGGTTRTLSYQYDANGNRIRITHPDGTFFTYNYDMVNRIGLVRESGVNWLNGFSYFDTGQPESQSYGGIFYTLYGYDGLGRLSVANNNLPGTAQDVQFTYSRNPASQLASRTSSNDAYAWAGHYAVNRAYTTNGLNQYSNVGGVPYGYDANGNLVSYTTSQGSQGFVYDVENRLVSASGAFNNATLDYDPLGRLWRVSNGSAATQFLYDANALVAEYDGSGTLLHRYVHGVGSDIPEAVYDYSGGVASAPRFLIPDERGSIIALSDTGGTSMALNTYDEYGIPGAANQGRFQYTGQAWLPELGMYYYKARIYSPTLGRFMQTDPIGYDGGNNLYSYVENDPLNRADSAGTCVDAQTPASTVRATARCQPPANVSVSTQGADTIIQNEGGVRLQAYASAEGGSPTVGIGHKVRSGENIRTGDTISREQVVTLFVKDILAADAAVHSFLGDTPISQEEFDALADLAFNAGGGVLSSRNSPNLNRAVRARDYEAMSNELRYTQGGGRTFTALEERSEVRRRMFRDGIYPRVPWRH